jgi:hypothetical protein
MSEREESVIRRLRVLLGHYCCPDCYQWKCTDKCGRRHQKELSEIGELIGGESFTKAHRLIEELSTKIGENEPEITRLTTLMAFLEGDE